MEYKRSGSDTFTYDKRSGSDTFTYDKRSGSDTFTYDKPNETTPIQLINKVDNLLKADAVSTQNIDQSKKDFELNHQRLMKDDINHAIEQNTYLAQIESETDKEKRFNLLKKYFTEGITTNLYQKMDLLYSSQTEFANFKDMYFMVGKFMFMNILLATDTLVNTKGKYKLELDQDRVNNIATNSREVPRPVRQDNVEQSDADTDIEYSICASYLKNKSVRR